MSPLRDTLSPPPAQPVRRKRDGERLLRSTQLQHLLLPLLRRDLMPENRSEEHSIHGGESRPVSRIRLQLRQCVPNQEQSIGMVFRLRAGDGGYDGDEGFFDFFDQRHEVRVEHFPRLSNLRGPDFRPHQAFWETGAVRVAVGVGEYLRDGGIGRPGVPGEVYEAFAGFEGAVLAGDRVAV